MPDLTPRLGIKKPLGNENVTRTSFNENWDIIDANAAPVSVAQMVKLTQDSGSIKIGEAIDVNNFVEAGQWFVGDAQGTINKPSTYGLLEVFRNSAEILQRFTEIGSISNGRQWFRQYSGSVWSSWVPVSATDRAQTYTNLPLASGISPNFSGTNRTPQYSVQGKKVVFRGELKGVTTGQTLIATMPSNLWPANPHFSIIPLNVTTGGYADVLVDSLNGQIKVWFASSYNVGISLNGLEYDLES